MTKFRLENLGYYPTEEITDYEWLALEYPYYHGFRTKYSHKDNGFRLLAYPID